MMEKKKVKAVRDGKVYTFSQKAWAIGNHTQHGFKLIGEVEEKDKIEVEKVDVGEVEEIKVEPVKEKIDIGTKVEVNPVEIEKEYPSDDEIRKFLLSNGVKFHHALGSKKLRKLYDENTK